DLAATDGAEAYSKNVDRSHLRVKNVHCLVEQRSLGLHSDRVNADIGTPPFLHCADGLDGIAFLHIYDLGIRTPLGHFKSVGFNIESDDTLGASNPRALLGHQPDRTAAE